MWIVQLSDFHLQKSSDIELINNKTDKAIEALSSRLKDKRDILFCICGDVIEKGLQNGYEVAEDVLKRIRKRFPHNSIHFEFVPGNHDICDNSFSDFDRFAKEFIDDGICNFSNSSVALKDYGDFDLVLINSVYHINNSYGLIDTNSLERLLSSSNKPKIAVIHHTLLSRYDGDSSTIRNGYKFSKFLSENNFNALLHGHTHGYSDLVLGKNCPVIGVGPIFKQVADVNNQFNLINIFRGRVISVENFYYRSDTDRFDSKFVLKNQYHKYFHGSSASKVQLDVLEEVKENGLICNLSFNVKTVAESFYKDIETAYPEVIPKAENWLAEKLPSNLPYNHAQYFNIGGNDGMKYVIEELNRKPTSSRAIIPLINTFDVVKSEDGFLPALNILQFGFNDDSRRELFVTVYLRALEVKHFLPINLCEIYLLSKRVTDTFRAAKFINITINAFRAQYKEVFGCHEKAKLDILTQGKIMMYLLQKDITNLKNLIKEKIELSETVIIDSGIRNLSICMREIAENPEGSFYCPQIVEKISSLQTECDQLITIRKSTSVYTDIQIAENKLIDSLKELEKLLNRMEKKS